MSTSLLRTLALATAMTVCLARDTASSESAEVLVNEWQPWGSVNFTSNSCDPSAGLIDLFGEYHRLIIALPNGTQVTHIWQYLEGTDAAGNIYHSLTTITLTDPPGTDFSSVVAGRLISQGSTDNYLYRITYTVEPPFFDVTINCTG
jgi:hypothetical protein